MIETVHLLFCDRGCGNVFEGWSGESVHQVRGRAERAGWSIADRDSCPACSDARHAEC